MTDARERLTRLIELAGESAPEKQRALAFELCELLTDWPQRYPLAMREPFEALLDKILRRLDGTTRRMIAERLARHPDTDPALLSAYYLDVPAPLRGPILARVATTGDAEIPRVELPDDSDLIEAARRPFNGDLADAFARYLGVSDAIARCILDDETGDALAVACKGAGVRRATYSALALLCIPKGRENPELRQTRLALLDGVPPGAAAHLLAHWRGETEAGSERGAST